MYILVKESDIKSKAVRERYHERVPDGRVILTPQELKTAGSIKDCQIVQTAKELKEMMKSGGGSTGSAEGAGGMGDADVDFDLNLDGKEGTDDGNG